MSWLASPTHSDADGHDPTAAPGAAVIVHAEESPAGSLELITTVRCEAEPVPLATHSCDEGHENAPTELTPGRLTSFHAPVPPPGLVELMTCPAPSEDTHNDTDGHAIERSDPAARGVVCHVLAPPPGLVETIKPVSEIAAHSELDGHEIAVRRLSPAMFCFCQAPAPPVGLLETSTFPSVSVAAQNEEVGHEIPHSAVESILVVVHVDAPPVGSVEVITFPFASTAAQNDADAHAIPLTRSTSVTVEPLPGSILAVIHADGPPVGSSEVRTSPGPSTAAQNPADGHDTATR